MTISILICLAAFLCLLYVLRRNRMSLGLPIAYLFSLLLIHVPGAYAHLISDAILHGREYTERGIQFTAVGSVCFVVGVWFARGHRPRLQAGLAANQRTFWFFCLIGGWFITYGLGFIGRIPSLSAAIDKGAAVWILGVLLGLRYALQRSDLRWSSIWLGALAVYPSLMLLLGGFVSYGATAVTIACSVLAVSTRQYWRVLFGLAAVVFLTLNLFPNYFAHRDDIRDKVWGGAPIDQRVEAVAEIFTGFEWFDPSNNQQLQAFDERLNQNYFAGLAAIRIQHNRADFLDGRSIWEGLLSLVPRALWPEKPVFGGSPKIVAEMTGLRLSPETSFGVGNVMEFYINFGYIGLSVGFLMLGWSIGTLDIRAAAAEAHGQLGRVFLYFLPGVALIQPNGSIVELTGGAAAALVAAYAWKWAWGYWSNHRLASRVVSGVRGRTTT